MGYNKTPKIKLKKGGKIMNRKDITMVWIKTDTHKIIKHNAIKKGAKLYAYTEHIIRLGLETEKKNLERRNNEIQKDNQVSYH